MVTAGKAAAGGPRMGEEKLIIRSEKVRFIDILSMLILRRPITSYAFVDAGDQTAHDIGITPGDIFVKLTELIQKVLASINTPAKWLGIFVEFVLNLIALNGGLLGIVWNIIRCTYILTSILILINQPMVRCKRGPTETEMKMRIYVHMHEHKLMLD